MSGKLEDRPLSSLLGDSELMNKRFSSINTRWYTLNAGTLQGEGDSAETNGYLLVQDKPRLHSEFQASQVYVE